MLDTVTEGCDAGFSRRLVSQSFSYRVVVEVIHSTVYCTSTFFSLTRSAINSYFRMIYARIVVAPRSLAGSGSRLMLAAVFRQRQPSARYVVELFDFLRKNNGGYVVR